MSRFSTDKVRPVVCSIPPRKVATYGDIAVKLAGDESARRTGGQAVGASIKSIGNDSEDTTRVHIVVRSKGEIPNKDNFCALDKDEIPVEETSTGWRVKNFEKYHWDFSKSK